jgi:magnesium transporter
MGQPTEEEKARRLRVLGLGDLDEARQLCNSGEFCWLDLEDPDQDTVEQVGEALGLHPLSIEDTQEFDQRPKLDGRHDRFLLVYYGAVASESGGLTPVEVHIHISRSFVLTVHRHPCPALARLYDSASHDPPDTEQWLIYRILDTLTDSLLDVLDGIVNTVSEHEESVLRKPRARDRDRMAEVRRTLDPARRIIVTQRQVFDRMVDRAGDMPALSPDLRPNYADVSDHLWRAVDDMETARDSLQNILDQYSNSIQERLTMVATIFLPLTVVTGFFGQNFTWMINHIGSAWTFWGLGVGGLAASVLAIWFWLVRTGMYDKPGRG